MFMAFLAPRHHKRVLIAVALALLLIGIGVGMVFA